jgi:urease accessory protein
MTSFSGLRSWALLGATAALGFVLIGQPAQAHGLAHGGLGSGFLHPITGIDHLLLLIGVGAAASYVSAQLLLWALAGAVLGAVGGALGASLPFAEALAASAVSAVALLILRSHQAAAIPRLGFGGGLVAGAVALHALLHSHEAPGDHTALAWWLGAFGASVLVSGGSFLLMRRLPLVWTARLALLLAVLGGVLALGPIGLLVR